MTSLELLAPARNADIGIAAIDCGADAVYIAGPRFGARKDAGNPLSEIGRLCDYAHRFGARVFQTVNIVIRPEEKEEVHRTMLEAQALGVDAFIIRDPSILGWKDIRVPLHASTQCAIRDASRASRYSAAGCARVILERQLSLDSIRAVRAVLPDSELEFFVHGALCVCYSGDCRLSEYLTGRSADRGECVQACRSLYDLYDPSGKLILKDKALLSLKDLNLSERLTDLADAGVSSFKIEGRLKNESYVRNIVRTYDKALNALIASRPGEYCRASFGKVEGGFTPDPGKTFNRGYTELFIDGRKSRHWSSMGAPKSMGEEVGTVSSVSPEGRNFISITLDMAPGASPLGNGDGFAFISGTSITGFRGDVCVKNTIKSKPVSGLVPGTVLFRNTDIQFEKSIYASPCQRFIPVEVKLSSVPGGLEFAARSADGRVARTSISAEGHPEAVNAGRQVQLFGEQLSKRSSVYHFFCNAAEDLDGMRLPLVSAAEINAVRRSLAQGLDSQPCLARPMKNCIERTPFAEEKENGGELMRSKYCILNELGMCTGGHAPSGSYVLKNNGRELALEFDCGRCEMVLRQARR